MALLQLRNMPIDNSGITPAELMYGRKVRNIVPEINKGKVESNKFSKILKDRQMKQKKYFDKGSKALKDFNVGDKVKIHTEGKKTMPHESGLIVGKHANPRSYKVKTEHDTVMIRNRKDLSKGTKFNVPRPELDIVIDEPKRVLNNSHNINNNCMNQEINFDDSNKSLCNTESNITTRSGRIIKKPEYLKEYVCLINVM